MEEQVGELWHRLITRLAETRYPEAAVRLVDVEHMLGIVFRALGGDGGLQVTAAEAYSHGAARTWLQRIAGSSQKSSLAWRDESYLRLPEQIDCFPETALNRDLYIWLAAIAVGDANDSAGDWFRRGQRLSNTALETFPGLQPRYQRLVAAHLAQRPDPQRMKPAEGEAERAIREALLRPGSVARLPATRFPPLPVVLWLHPSPPGSSSNQPSSDEGNASHAPAEQQKRLEKLRRKAERVEEPDADRGLVTVRMENIFTWGEYVNADRGSEDEDDLARAEAIARDLDTLAVSKDSRSSTSTLKFDLDLPSEAEDDRVIGEGIRYPEWDWKRRDYLPDYCRIQPMMAREAAPCDLPAHLHRTAKRLRNQFQALAPARVWYRGQPDGQEIDIDAYLRFATDRAAGSGIASEGLYREMRAGDRDLACLLMADLSLSTDTWIDDHHRVIDVIRDSLYLFAESLDATGDRFGIYGFSSRKRDPVRVHILKSFDERYTRQVRGRIEVIKPGYYTRMGAALRHATELLKVQPANRRLLLLLTDGKPNDLDRYEGRHGIEDTRQAIIEARQIGLQPFCVTIDEEGNDYLPHLFGQGGYVVIRRPADLPKQLPLLYARLTA